MKTMHRLLCIPALAGCLLTSHAAVQKDPLVDAPAGKVQGRSVGELHVFKGIAYALPPVGHARWRAPVAMPRWDGVRDGADFGPACMQPKPAASGVYAGLPVPLSEDCLTLNIWAPANAKNAPVIFWIHGGALVSGSGRDPLNDGGRLATHGAVVITINYRLGVFGWLAHPELSRESAQDISGNYGLLDQILALQWVQHNIRAFGGDPANVTIAGESAGGLSVMYLLAAPGARGLFAKALAESAYMISTPELKKSAFGAPSAEDSGVKLMKALNAADLAALRALDAEQLSVAAPMHGFSPFAAVDGKVFPRQLVDAFDKGEQAHVPLLAGFNSGEIRSLRALAPKVPESADVYVSTIKSQYLDLADAFLRQYPSNDLQESILATTRDALYGWTAERLAIKQTAIGQPAYLYFFDHGYAAEEALHLHGFHASELPFVFGTFTGTPPHWPAVEDNAAERSLSEAMMSYWTSFARNGHPTAPHEPDWQAFGTAGHYMNFKEAPRMAEDLLPGMYELNEQVMCRRRASGAIGWNWNVGLWSPVLPAQQAACK